MDLGDSTAGSGDDRPPRAIPADLPTSLDDRRHRPAEGLVPETEMYDGWQGPSAAPPLPPSSPSWQATEPPKHPPDPPLQASRSSSPRPPPPSPLTLGTCHSTTPMAPTPAPATPA